MTHSDAKVSHPLTHPVSHPLTHSQDVYAGQATAPSTYLSHSLVTGAPAPEHPSRTCPTHPAQPAIHCGCPDGDARSPEDLARAAVAVWTAITRAEATA